ncbi:Golgi coiled-coil protein Tmf1 [Schizosaccharomyces pombe]|uniref:Protein sgm1 n=1 Tax=Schizosaccharomyces pombe (strain 972 / ATCC 24843) TaxID=284812 RepID=SGM1_SCHPO|nr:TATA element modulatory factor-like protein [Schizosaccharomyces pombe]Q9Y7Y1.1 RecName: Full=Protein sgm1 [Schizosaccharomyces pombe 972h-]CAB44759.1 TATA element modulatory factor homolog (predicted) [Schizosaccharomyces pombe]|eukprot:NP_596036.1 TATA element modulatory factor-like protein [Schizosaccharomyces pombe]
MENSKWGGFLKKAMSNVETSIDKVLDGNQIEEMSRGNAKSKDEIIAKLLTEGQALSKNELKLNNTIKQLKKSLSEAETKLKRLDEKQATPELQVSDSKEMEEQLELQKSQFEKRISILEKEKEDLQRKMEELTVESMEVVRLTRQVETLSTQYSIQRSQWVREDEKKKKEIQDLKELYEKSEHGAKNWERERETFQNQVSQMSKQLDSLEKLCERKDEEIRSSQAFNMTLREENDTLAAQNLDLQTQLDRLQRELDTNIRSNVKSKPKKIVTTGGIPENNDYTVGKVDTLKVTKEDEDPTTPTNAIPIPSSMSKRDEALENDKDNYFDDLHPLNISTSPQPSPLSFSEIPQSDTRNALENFLDNLPSPSEERSRISRSASEARKLGINAQSRYASISSAVLSPPSEASRKFSLYESEAISPTSGTPSNLEKGAGNVPDVSLLEQLATTIRRLEAELQTTKQQVAQLIIQRDQARQEIVDAYVNNDANEDSKKQVEELRLQLQNLEKEHASTLVTLKQKSDKVFELELDIKDMRELYVSQIDILAGRQ